MRNVTLAVDESDLRAARVRAASENTTVTAVLRARLVEYANNGAQADYEDSWEARFKAASGHYPSRLGPTYLEDLRSEWPA
ncbi:MAG: hypothetical protein LBK95_11545 [Bifidobacteriaceae bacterium]|jgi:hypothetical protein|nr:hypothetical protein [Bifidobacteriaceae bacterium]